MRMRREDYEGHGVYERTHGDTGMLDAMTYGVYAPIGQLPLDVAGLFAPLDATEERNGLVYVRSEAKEAAIGALSLLKFNGNPPPPAVNVTGYAEMPLAPPSGNWVKDYVSKGYAVMVDRTSAVAKGPPVMVACSKDPVAVAATAGKGKSAAVVDGPDTLLAAAESIAKSAAPTAPAPSAGGCPAGSVKDPIFGTCVPIPAGIPGLPWADPSAPAQPQAAPAPAPAKSSYIVPVLVGAVAIAIVGALIMAPTQPVAARSRRR